jgi:hypothetical protein
LTRSPPWPHDFLSSFHLASFGPSPANASWKRTAQPTQQAILRTLSAQPHKIHGDLTGFIETRDAASAMKKIQSPPRIVQPSLAAGQLWRMAGADLRVGTVGKLLVHYKLGKPNAVRVPNSVNPITTVEKYLKAKKAVLA